jgi:hypothetical protein
VEHVEDYFGFLRNLKHIGKYKVLHIPLEIYMLRVIRPSSILDEREKIGHIQWFTKETILATLTDIGSMSTG